MRCGHYAGGIAVLLILVKLCLVGVKAYLGSERSAERAAAVRQLNAPITQITDDQARMMRESQARMQQMQSGLPANPAAEAAHQRAQQMMDEMRQRQEAMRQRAGF